MAHDDDVELNAAAEVGPESVATALAGAIARDAAAKSPDMAARVATLLDEQTRVLREQGEVLRLQKEQLREETGLRRRMLHFEHASAGMKVAFEIAVAFIVIAIAAILGGAIWSAINDNGLVVEAFSVPSDYDSRGLSGQVLASHLLDRLSDMDARAKSSHRALRTIGENRLAARSGVWLCRMVKSRHGEARLPRWA